MTITRHSDGGRAHHRGPPPSGRLRFFRRRPDRRRLRGGHHRRADTVPDCLSHLTSSPTVLGCVPNPEDPPVLLPAIDVFASNADKAQIDSASSRLSSVEGVTVSPAKCDGSSQFPVSTIFGADVVSSANGTVVNAGDSSSVITERLDHDHLRGRRLGHPTNMATMLTICVNADGSGTYTPDLLSLTAGIQHLHGSPARPSPTTGNGSSTLSRAPSPSSTGGDGTTAATSPSLTINNEKKAGPLQRPKVA